MGTSDAVSMVIEHSPSSGEAPVQGSIRLVRFRLPSSCGASSARLFGSFDGWAEGYPMRLLADGSFEVGLELPDNSRVEFRYLLDGSIWQNDPDAHDFAPNQFGGYNSVVYTSSPAQAGGFARTGGG